MHTIYHLLLWRVDLVIMLGAVAFGIWYVCRYMRRHFSHLRMRWTVWASVLGLTVGTGLMAELMQRDRTRQLVTVFSGFGPTYAEELRQMGHAKITLETPPDDPGYLRLIEAQKMWLRANSLVADIYTYRLDEAGNIRLIVDSETDYDRNGRFEDEREERTKIGEVYEDGTDKFKAALNGNFEFESDVMVDRWGTWVSSFSPIRGPDGRVEAAVGIDYPAEAWIMSILWVRTISLVSGLIVIAIVMISNSAYAVVAAEVRERRQIQSQLEEAREAALLTSAAKSEFLAVTGHEIRSPLTTITISAAMMAESDLSAAQRKYIEAITASGKQLTELVSGLLDFSKIEDGQFVLAQSPWRPAEAINELLDMMTPSAAQKGVALHFDNRFVGPLTVLGDVSRVRQILLNLLSNAVKFTKQGSVTIQAAWAAIGSETEGQLVISVIDTGVGIPAEAIPGLFQLYNNRESESARGLGRRGSGLAISKRLVEMMGGAISVRSAGRGSTFSFTIPCQRLEPEKEASVVQRASRPRAVSEPRVLIVDDDSMTRDLMKLTLERRGLVVEVAGDGEEALSLVLAKSYQAVFLDLRMPGWDGFTTASKIREKEAPDCRVPIIAVSGLDVDGTRDKCMAAGMDDYLRRPVYLPALYAIIDEFAPVDEQAVLATPSRVCVPAA